MTVAEHQGADVRQARLRAVREGVGLLVTSLVVGMAFLWPLGAVLIRAVPQVALMVPAPARHVTVYLDGLPGDDEAPPEGAEGLDDLGLDEPADADVAPDPAEGAVDEVPTEDPTEEAPDPPAEDVPEEEDPADVATEPTPPDEPRPQKEIADADIDAVASVEPLEHKEPKRSGKGRRGRCQEPHPDIKKTGPGAWRVQRSLIDWYTSDLDRFNSLGYSRKFHEDGIKGWQVGGFGCMSPLWKGGLRSRDVIRTVNGKKTNNVVQLLGIWISQRKKDTFTVELLRKGEPMTLRYTIVGDER